MREIDVANLVFGQNRTGATAPPIHPRAVGGEVDEARGDELAKAGAQGPRVLPMLPLLGQPGYIVRGWSIMLAGYPRSGKTELLVRLVGEWLAEDPSLEVLYLTEEARPLWEFRLGRLPSPWDRLHVVFGLGTAPNLLLWRAFQGSEQVVVMDATRNLLGLKDENDNAEIARVLKPWVTGARQTSKTLVASHHMRKGEGEHGEGIGGGHAWLASVDIALELRRDRTSPRRRVLRVYARLISPSDLMYERKEDGTFRALGDPAELRLVEVCARISPLLTSDWQKTRAIQEALDEPRPSVEQVRQALIALARDGEAERDPSLNEGEAPGKTHWWRRVPT